MKKIQKLVASSMLAAAVLAGGASAAEAATVWYKGSAVNWDYGRSWGVYSYSNVQSGSYSHSATANGTWSGWKNPGVQAQASQFVGTGQATAYWNCRG